jgi:hypothetical protein
MGGLGFVIAMTVALAVGALCSVVLIPLAPLSGVLAVLLFAGLIWLMWWLFLRYG